MDDAAPIVQLLLTIQFKQLVRDLTLFDYADLRTVFTELPVYRQVPQAGPMPVLQPVPIAIPVIGDAPRVQFVTEDLEWEVLFQEDRVSVGWNRLTPLDHSPNYPGFGKVFARLLDAKKRIATFLMAKGHDSIDFSVGEIAYSDTLLVKPEQKPGFVLENIFTNVKSNPEFKFSVVNLNYARVSSGEYPSHIETNISGPSLSPSGELGFSLRTTVRFEIGEEGALSDRFEAAHQEAGRNFKALVKPEAYAILVAK